MLILVFLVCTWQVRLRVEGGPRGTSGPHKWFQQPNISLGRIRMLFSGFVAFYKRGKSENFACFVEVRAIAVYLYKFKLCKSIQNFHSQLPSNFHFDPRSKTKSSYSPTKVWRPQKQQRFNSAAEEDRRRDPYLRNAPRTLQRSYTPKTHARQ